MSSGVLIVLTPKVGHSIHHLYRPPLLSLTVLIVRTPKVGHSIHHL